MSGWQGFSPLAPLCPDCGAQLDPWTGDLGIGDPRDNHEAARAGHALAIQTHRHHAHRIEPAIGDLVTYATPWRGHVLVSDTYRVDAIRPDQDFHDYARSMGNPDLPPLIGTSYTLVNPHRSDDRCFPFIGDPTHPLTFELVTAAPPVEHDLLDLLGEWDAA